MSSKREKLIQDLILESGENLDRLDDALVRLEEQQEQKDLLADVFRTIHTIKGSCGFLGFPRLERLAHAGENLLSLMRDGDLVAAGEHMDGLLRLVDIIRASLAFVSENLDEPEDDYQAMVVDLLTLAVEAGHPPTGPLAEFLEAAADHVPDPVEEAPAEEEDEAPTTRRGQSSLRIQVGQLDDLMNLVGELVLVRNQIVQHVTQVDDPTGAANAHRLDHITSELQEGIMKVRMQPIGHLWSRFPRVVRDLSKSLGKRIRVEMEGQDTELDKSLLEAIADPLTHVVRNAIDHGIEAPDDRMAAGKPAEGVLRLRAFHESGHINIEVSDDGNGINIERVRALAVERGVITAARAANMAEREIAQLVFEPGFSTATEVTNVSGRGVGMDVVKTNIEKIGGIVDLVSREGRGTTLKIRIPLTLAIVPALVVTCAGARYAIPQVSLVELVRLEGEQAQAGIEFVHGSPVHRLRGQLLPLAVLSEQLELSSGQPIQGEQGGPVNIIVLQADGERFGLVVDEINDTEEIVVKPLDAHLKGALAYAGTTIMGDGQVALILDVLGLALRAGVVNEERKQDDLPAVESAHVKATETYLIFQVDDQRRTAIPLRSVYRLEEFQRSEVEYAGGRPVVQYRDTIMPLIDVRAELGLSPTPEGTEDQGVQVVVHEVNGSCTGLMVSQITDIVEDAVHVRSAEAGPGIAESIVLAGVVTDVLDLDALVTGRGGATSETQLAGAAREGQSNDSLQVCTFQIGDHLFGVEVHRVQEVLRYQAMTAVPLTSSTVKGLINLRGQTVTALDLRDRLGIAPLEPRGDEQVKPPMNVVLMAASGIVSVLVDEIGDVLEIESSAREEVPETVDPQVRDFIEGVYKLPDRLLLLLNIERSVAQTVPVPA